MSGIEIYGLDQTAVSLERTGDKLERGSLDVVRKYARKMIRTAREYAPIKEGYLENSIQILGEEAGYRGRKTVEWGVEARRLGPGYKKYGVRYDVKMEIGDFNSLGERSLEKAADGYDVGAGYIERAVWEWEGELGDELDRLAADLT